MRSLDKIGAHTSPCEDPGNERDSGRDSGEVVTAQSIMAGRDAPQVLGVAERPLNPIAPLVGDPAVPVGQRPGGRGLDVSDQGSGRHDSLQER